MISRRTAGRPPWWRRGLLLILLVGGTLLAARVLYDSSDELFSAADDLTDLQPGWVIAAFAAEALCYLARGAAQRRLLDSGTRDPDGPGGGRAGTLVLAGTTLAGDAVAYCLPLGFAAAGVVTLRILRRRSVSQIVAGWMFGVATLLYVAVLAVLAIIAAQLAGDEGPAGLQAFSAAILGVLVAVLVAVLAARRWSTSSVTRPGRRLLDRLHTALRGIGRAERDRATAAPGWSDLPRRLGRRAVDGVRSWWAQVRLLRLSASALVVATVGMLVSWLADIGVLAASYAALGAVPPWTGLLLAYCAGQIVSSVPLTPGGIGVVEGSLTLALVAFGGSTETTLAAVLLYRLISHWACIPAGGLAWLALRSTAPADPATVTSAPRDAAVSGRVVGVAAETERS